MPVLAASFCIISLPSLNRPAHAALAEGAKAPNFTLEGALAGKNITFSLRAALTKGPVVLYFFPAAFTAGCTQEAHDFAAAADQFKAQGATLVGITAGNTDRVAEFSKVECRDRFAVLADPGALTAVLYHSVNTEHQTLLSQRTSYVIAPDGTILLSFTSNNPEQHVAETLDALKKWHNNKMQK
ncbi:alkyl hydroperoxide reductase [Acetobacter okinawensis]|uniref:thioredoxin-dependent peroxiredoxin n=1 Tax=Acetobacter okinawensis TaxID=1076594 RepID=A0A252BTX7_9PROT|nr:alkyl hydroperoxide reductase [Acetobacter okinawensis]